MFEPADVCNFQWVTPILFNDLLLSMNRYPLLFALLFIPYQKTSPSTFAEGLAITTSRGDWTRTSDPLHPMQVRYRAALHPELGGEFSKGSLSG